MFFGQFEIIPVIAKTKSFSKAAKILHLSQPAVSSKVQAMEDYYKVKLFNRTAQGVTLTRAGQIVAAYADQFISLHQAMDDDLRQVTQLASSNLSVGASCTAGNFAMPSSIGAFKQIFPDAHVKLDIANTSVTIKKLINKEIDVAVVEGELNFPGINSHLLDQKELVLVCSAGDVLGCRNEITLRELKNKPFIMREKGAAIPEVLKKAFSHLGYDLYDFNIIAEMNSIHSVKAAVEGGLGISIVPRIAVESELAAGLLREVRIKDFADQLIIDIHLVYLAEEEPSVAAQKFIHFLTRAKNRGFSWNETARTI